jgi:hypothetical protein
MGRQDGGVEDLMNIKEHIEAGHYPKDDKGRALVPVGCAKVATICATDAPGEKPILGFIRSDDKLYQACWNAWDEHGNNCPSQPRACWVDLLPPPPRKVKVLGWAILCPNKLPRAIYATENEAKAFAYGRPVVEMTGEHEEPWS